MHIFSKNIQLRQWCGQERDVNTLMQCMFHLYSKPDGALAQKVRHSLIEVANLRVTTCKNPAIAVAKAISTVAE